MSKVFADSDYWIALFQPNEQLHRRAAECSRRLQRKRVVTTEMVMAEVSNYYSNQGPQLREAVAKWAAGLPKNGKITVVPQSSEQFHRAVEFYGQRLDKEWSLTDCASMLIMKEQAIVEAITSDHHFKQAGFRALLRGLGLMTRPANAEEEPRMNTDGHGFYGAEKAAFPLRPRLDGSIHAQNCELHHRPVPSAFIRVHPWFQLLHSGLAVWACLHSPAFFPPGKRNAPVVQWKRLNISRLQISPVKISRSRPKNRPGVENILHFLLAFP